VQFICRQGDAGFQRDQQPAGGRTVQGSANRQLRLRKFSRQVAASHAQTAAAVAIGGSLVPASSLLCINRWSYVVKTLHDFFDSYVHGGTVALVYDDGFRCWSYSYDWLRATAGAFAIRLDQQGLRPGDRVAIWSENRPEWVAAFWACVLHGVVVIPIDARASPALVRRIVRAAEPRGILTGDDVEALQMSPGIFVWRLRDIDLSAQRASSSHRTAGLALPGPARPPADPDTLAEIVFTSGTTGDPKGVLITHANILGNIAAIEPEATRYGPYLWPLRPLRFLNLLPLSHMFGQALTIFLPPLVRAASVFVRGYNPDEIVARIRRHRITLVVTVPRVLDMLRDRLRVRVPHCGTPESVERSLAARLWRYRNAHRLFWWKFCGFVVGGAQLNSELEDFWRRLGFAVIQGYGLTETAPMVTWNHPFKPKPGTVGKPLEGIDVRIADDGEVLVRGPTVTRGYLNAPAETQSALEGGWLHTGDLGAFDETGHLLIRGRKKEMIVTPEGLNVFPEDVERVLDHVPGVSEAAVVGRRVDGAEQVHAVLILRPDTQPSDVVRAANAALEPYQRIRDYSIWPGATLPRTDAIRKLKRHEIRTWVETGAPPDERAPAPGDDIERLLAPYAHGRRMAADTTFDELGLTSLDRVELVTALEDRANVALSEAALVAVKSVEDLRRVVAQAARSGQARDTIPFPRWNRGRLVRTIRNLSLATWILPPTRVFIHLAVEGRHHLEGLNGPVIFAPNHQSHFDIPAVLRALPHRWRRTIAVPMWKEYFDAHFFPERHTVGERAGNSTLYWLLACFFNAFPLPQTEPGVRQTLRYIGELVTDGCSILLFPEGERTNRGEIKRFLPGVGMIASRLHLPVVPVRLEGVDRVLHRTWRWPRPGPVRVTFGSPLTLEGDDYQGLTRRVEDAVRKMGAAQEASSSEVA
jgi:long-chain acyl-CoA synthetase